MLLVTLSAVVFNRVVAVALALWWRVPVLAFMPALLAIDVIQIPMFYWVYQNGSSVLLRLPSPVSHWFQKDPSSSTLGRWASSLGGVGVMTIAALPTFGGGMWSAVFLSYSLGLRRVNSYLWLTLGSVLSYAAIYCVVGTLVSAIRYLAHA